MPHPPTRIIYCIGETLLDIIFSQGKPVSAKPGGSLMNTAVSLARSGMTVQLLSEAFHDDPGRMILDFLHENNVFSDFLTRYDQGSTPIALAFLDDAGDANYVFYKDYPENRLNGEFPAPGADDIILFGSFYAISTEIREKLCRFLQTARNNEAIIIYDPNFRSSHTKELAGILPAILNNISFSDITRGSHEDFLHIFASDNPGQVYNEVRNSGCKNLIYTRSGKEVTTFTDQLHLTTPVPGIVPVSTIGAGDAFNAGLIFGLLKEDIRKKDISHLNESQWSMLINQGIRFSQEVCMSLDNYVAKNFVLQKK